MAMEHEVIHVEILLYMLVQPTLLPTGLITPSWISLAEGQNTSPTPQFKNVTLRPSVVSLKQHDDEGDHETRFLVEGHEFGCDNKSKEAG